MGILAIHSGDLHLRTAYLGPLDAPALIEDQAEPARFVTPAIVTLDDGGALIGYPALMACASVRKDPVTWRYRRAGLLDRSIAARDGSGRGLTSETFLAFAAGRLCSDAQAYAGSVPDLALVVPDDLADELRRRLAAALESSLGAPVQLVGEAAALLCADDAAPDGSWLVASADDDALRLRIVRKAGSACETLAADEIAAAGLAAIRRRWLAAWDAQVAALVPGASGFGAGDTYEFERVWQELWESLDSDAADPGRSLSWPLLRGSSVISVCAHAASLLNDLRDIARSAVARATALRGAHAPALTGLLVVASPALRRVLGPALAGALGLDSGACRACGPDAYVRGAAALARRGAGLPRVALDHAPHALGVLGMGEDGATTLRPLFEAGQPLPASSKFTIVADRDAQKQVAVTLSRPGESGDGGRRFEFGPLVGSGVQRLGITVEWRADGSLEARAQDRETGAPVPCRDCVEILGGVALASARHLANA